MTFLLLSALGAYLIGSIPFGLILTKLAGHGDIRDIGSGNIGATNVLRTGNKWLALATLALDFGKAFLPIKYIIWQEYAFWSSVGCVGDGCGFGNGYWFASLPYIATATILGHMFPIWLKFKGGKGVACIFGIGFALSSTIGFWIAVCWLTVFALYRYSSLAAIIGIPAGILIASQNEAVGSEPFMLALPVLLMIAKHRENIRRLIKGEEHKFSFVKKKEAD